MFDFYVLSVSIDLKRLVCTCVRKLRIFTITKERNFKKEPKYIYTTCWLYLLIKLWAHSSTSKIMKFYNYRGEGLRSFWQLFGLLSMKFEVDLAFCWPIGTRILSIIWLKRKSRRKCWGVTVLDLETLRLYCFSINKARL
jgi:hypothetical protein